MGRKSEYIRITLKKYNNKFWQYKMSHYPESKEKLIRSLMVLFWDKTCFTKEEIDRRLHSFVPDEIRRDPTCDVDHLRLGIVELGLFERDGTGATYKFNSGAILARENIKSMLGEHYPVERVKNLAQMKKKMKKIASSHGIG